MKWERDTHLERECYRIKGRVRSAFVALTDEGPGWYWGASRDGVVMRNGREAKKADAQLAAERAMRNI